MTVRPGRARNATRRTRRSRRGRACPASRGSPSGQAPWAWPRLRSSSCLPCWVSVAAGRGASPSPKRDRGGRHGVPGSDAGPRADGADLHHQEERHAAQDRQEVRPDARGAPGREQGDDQERGQDQGGPGDHHPGVDARRGDRPVRRGTRGQRDPRTIRRGPQPRTRRTSRGAMLIAVIFPASTRNVASMCWVGAPGRTTSRSAS